MKRPLTLVLVATACWAATGCESAPRPTATETLVEEAIAHIQEKGTAAFADFRKSGSRWFDGETYVFVSETSGTNLVMPPRPAMEGENLIDRRDADGKLFVQAMRDIVIKSGSGWVDYKWPKPGATEPSHKSSFVKKTTLNGRELIVGSGVYR